MALPWQCHAIQWHCVDRSTLLCVAARGITYSHFFIFRFVIFGRGTPWECPAFKLIISQLYISSRHILEPIQTNHGSYVGAKPVSPKPRKMRSTILSRMAPFSGREASRRADSRRNRLVTKRTNWLAPVYVTYHRPCSKPNCIFRGGIFWIVPAHELICW